MVLEAPPKVLAFLDDFWFQYVIDIGNAGPDKGQGGKYLVVPPGYKGEVPEGYFVARSRTFNLWLMGRGFKVNGDLKPGVESIKKNLRIYPLAQAKNPPETKFINGSGVELNTVHANDFSYFEELNEIVQEEPSEALDPERLGLFASIGIEKGKAFAPDARMKKILTEPAAVGNATSRAILFRTRMKEAYFYRGSAWVTTFARRKLRVFVPVRRAQSRCTDYVSLLRHRHHPGDGHEDGRDWLTIRRRVRRLRRQATGWRQNL